MFELKTSKNINGFDVNVFELKSGHDELLRNTIKAKIQKIKLYQEAAHADLLPPTMSESFKKKFTQTVRDICTPHDHKLKWFDVKRGFSTEFISQLLLERQYNCIFHEEADKKINLSPVNVDKQIPGIDVVGLQENQDDYKFVVCEIKASKEDNIPCTSAVDLLDDVKFALESDDRIAREIFQYIQGLSGTKDDSIQKIVTFLANLLLSRSSKDILLNQIVFFPFLIRNNAKILEENNLDDFSIFNPQDLQNINLSGVIWSFNEDISDFCNNIYKEAIEELKDAAQ